MNHEELRKLLNEASEVFKKGANDNATLDAIAAMQSGKELESQQQAELDKMLRIMRLIDPSYPK
jgi:hypothetical protein